MAKLGSLINLRCAVIINFTVNVVTFESPNVSCICQHHVIKSFCQTYSTALPSHPVYHHSHANIEHVASEGRTYMYLCW